MTSGKSMNNEMTNMKSMASPFWTAVWMSVLTLAAESPAPADQTNQPGPAVKPEKTITGTVSTVNPQDHTLETKGALWWMNHKFNLGDSCAYLLPDNKPGTINDLRPGQRIQVRYEDAGGVLVADRIAQLALRNEGMVKAIDPVRHTLTIHVRIQDKTFQLANECQVVLRNDQPGTLADIQPGEHVTVTYELPGHQPTARQIAQTSQSFTGALVALDVPDRTVKAQDGLQTKKFNLADHCAIVVNGQLDGRLDDLKPNDRLVFSYDVINGVNIVSRIAPAPVPPANTDLTTGTLLPGMPAGMGY